MRSKVQPASIVDVLQTRLPTQSVLTVYFVGSLQYRSTNMSVSNVDENVWALTLLVVSIKRNVGGSPASFVAGCTKVQCIYFVTVSL